MNVGLFSLPVRFAMFPPIDIASLAAYLRKRGHKVYARDFTIELPQDNDCDSGYWDPIIHQRELYERHTKLVEQWVDYMLSVSLDAIGFSVWPSQCYFSLQAARLIKEKKPSIKIVFGGPWCSHKKQGWNIITNESVDFLVFGEGEETLREIIEEGQH
ncbi:MAG: cobalamin-dependent protein, partial [Candidatus Omnitrophota bacterium]